MNLKERYVAREGRYEDFDNIYQRCGRSGVLLPKVSLGFWHNFGGVDPYERSRAIAHYAFDHGVTSVLVGASSVEQMACNLNCIHSKPF